MANFKSLGTLLVALVVVVSSGTTLTGCQILPNLPFLSPTVSPEQLAADDARRKHATPGINSFGFKVFADVASQSPNENVALSPTSLGRALLMVDLGARGSTQAAIASALGMPDQSSETLGDWVAATKPNLNQSGVSIQVSDSAWIRSNFSVLPSYLSDLETYLNAGVGSFRDGRDGTAKIGDWISRVSNGLLDGHGFQLDDSVMLALADVLTFKGRWDKVFDQSATQQRPFHVSPTQTITVPMMHQSGDYLYGESEGYQLIRLPYQRSAYSMYVMLASDSATVSAPLNVLLFESMIASASSHSGEIWLPRFSFDDNTSLTASLKAIGLAIAFSDGADLSGIAPNLELSDAWQQIHVKVDETGTVAAAATEIAMATGAAPVFQKPFSMEVNRPFYFAIRDDSTKAVLFIGRVVNPQ